MSGKPRFATAALRELLEELVVRYDDAQYRSTDPVLFAHRYPDPEDREIAALLAAGLAYGRVASILASVEDVLGRLGPHPAGFVDRASASKMDWVCEGFQHRWTTGADVASLLKGVRGVRKQFGSLGAAFAAGLELEEDTARGALFRWVTLLREEGAEKNSLLADPAGPSACKRLWLYLRWMVRNDQIDPGGWAGIPTSKLVIPVDVHMHRMGEALGFTRRKQADFRTALEVTEGFRTLCPEDPVRYDFCLTRPGIIDGADLRNSRSLRDLKRALGLTQPRKLAPQGRTLDAVDRNV